MPKRDSIASPAKPDSDLDPQTESRRNTADLPRERIRLYGPRALSDRELVAAIISSGSRRHSIFVLADRVMRHAENLSGLANLTVGKLQEIEGIGEALATRICAATELGRRSTTVVPRLDQVYTAADVVSMIGTQVAQLGTEHFWIVLLSTKSEVIAVRQFSVGDELLCPISPRVVFREALSHGAFRIICVHNHPSGDTQPSPQDMAFTRNLLRGAKLLGILFEDHIIIASQRAISGRNLPFFSMKEAGILKALA